MDRYIFAKVIRALAVGGDISNARAYATNAYGAASPATQWLATKAAALETGDIEDPDGIGLSGIGDFVSLVQRENLITKIRDALGGGFREMVPFRAVTLETEIAGASWTAEAALKVVDANTAFGLQRFGVRKCTGTLIATAELVRFVNERSDAVLQRGLARAVAGEISRTFAGNSAPSDASPRRHLPRHRCGRVQRRYRSRCDRTARRLRRRSVQFMFHHAASARGTAEPLGPRHDQRGGRSARGHGGRHLGRHPCRRHRADRRARGAAVRRSGPAGRHWSGHRECRRRKRTEDAGDMAEQPVRAAKRAVHQLGFARYRLRAMDKRRGRHQKE
ncbi:hypothetical protein HDG40_004339 [Paraburkholderia sp. JPY158]|uniref:Uncharacterized protein n=1 Tax=Paraburkholderia atlantica TaxID=2654982 RepID=A0A7W8QAL5_PARAM|nr:hypothetical protein [Paraburkholderia atlantica]MBB5426165.1 hypothetical protein [Paraburkholderia atlantica]